VSPSPSPGSRSERERLLAGVLRDHHVGAELDALRAHHRESWEHCHRVARACADIARELHEAAAERDGLVLAGLLHDVGKLRVPSAVLRKPGELASDERELVQGHAELGFAMLERLDHHPARLAVLQHHRHVADAYPKPERVTEVLREGWSETDLLLGDSTAQVIALVDMFDALTHRRAYKGPREPADVEETVRRSFRGQACFLELVASRWSRVSSDGD
jgi:putative two-component system response regulator